MLSISRLRPQLILVLVLCILYACGTAVVSPTSFLVGEWQARWLFMDTTALSQEKNLRYDMDGYLHFQKDGILHLTAYGCPNCIMGKDTIAHELHWKYEGDTLLLQNREDQVDLTYQLTKKKGEDTLYFLLLEQVQLRLTRLK